MRLKQLKLAGFKSFVDPTKIVLTSALTAIVGPNGCGKSNIIDAVRWVLGESSAKNLRGEGMTDVIFNGSNARKPVSQASVELIFDNHENKAQGPWQSYSEIAIKRQVSRDGQSDYFINGHKCRRRDITDLLAGTGLGPRSYAIIEQGTISRLVESKPQELRVFIEEAAGITKYKERRRETEVRIKHSRENLSRLSDLKQELDSQVSNLESQAQDAEQYTALKAQERQLNQDIMVLRWKNFQLEFEQAQLQLIEKQQQLAQLAIELKSSSEGSQRTELEINSLKSQLNTLLQQCYQQEANVAKASAQLKLLTKQRAQQGEEQDKLKLAHDANTSSQAQQDHKVTQAQDEVARLAPQLAVFTERLAALATQCRASEQLNEQADQQLTRSLNQQSSIRQQLELAEHSSVRITQDQLKLASQRELLNDKLKTCRREREALAPQAKTDNYQQLRQQYQESLATLTTAQQQAQHGASKLESHHQQLLALDNAVTRAEHSITTIEMLVASKLPTCDDRLNAHYQDCQQLWQRLDVRGHWQRAVELVLGDFLQAFCVDKLIAPLPDSPHRVIEKITLPAPQIDCARDEQLPFELLSSHIRCDYGVSTLLCGIYCATDPERARVITSQLGPGQSVITPDGQWFGQGFVVISDSNTTAQTSLGLIELQQQLLHRGSELAQLGKDREQHRATGVALKQLVTQQQARQQEQQQAVNQYQEQMVEAKQQWLLEQQKWQHVCDQYQDISRQIVELEKLEQLEQQQLQQLAEQQGALNDRQQQLTESTQGSRNSVSLLKKQLSSERNQYQKLQHLKHEAELQLQKQQMQLNAAQLRLNQMNELVAENQQLLTKLSLALSETDAPLTEQNALLAQGQQQLTQSRQQHQDVEQQLDKVTALGQQAQRNAGDCLTKKSQLEAEINRVNLASETLKVKLAAQHQALEISVREMAELASRLVVSPDSKDWSQLLTGVKQQLEQIGPINLTAINQYNEQKQRCDHLARQIDDLEQALTTLESAIKKIDRESREKFKLTFDAVNRDFKQLFPKVFGGGNAQLALTDSDLLSSGVSIMAQPPGKKNSTIHLLSGGEKALTALSLVFAIFQLNPAPFCMLDEVDAPLDDANVERYCNLVKEMAEKVQFIFITHNKVSMEMAEHLTGVTMIEAGVSRVVAVDVEQAISLV